MALTFNLNAAIFIFWWLQVFCKREFKGEYKEREHKEKEIRLGDKDLFAMIKREERRPQEHRHQREHPAARVVPTL